MGTWILVQVPVILNASNEVRYTCPAAKVDQVEIRCKSAGVSTILVGAFPFIQLDSMVFRAVTEAAQDASRRGNINQMWINQEVCGVLSTFKVVSGEILHVENGSPEHNFHVEGPKSVEFTPIGRHSPHHTPQSGRRADMRSPPTALPTGSTHSEWMDASDRHPVSPLAQRLFSPDRVVEPASSPPSSRSLADPLANTSVIAASSKVLDRASSSTTRLPADGMIQPGSGVDTADGRGNQSARRNSIPEGWQDPDDVMDDDGPGVEA